MNETDTIAQRLRRWCADVGVGAAELEVTEWAEGRRRIWGWEVWQGEPLVVAFCPDLIEAVADDVDEYVDTVVVAAGAELVSCGGSDDQVEEARSMALIEHGALGVLWGAHCRGLDNTIGVRGDLAGGSGWARRLGL